jgi:hypothetical protein
MKTIRPRNTTYQKWMCSDNEIISLLWAWYTLYSIMKLASEVVHRDFPNDIFWAIQRALLHIFLNYCDNLVRSRIQKIRPILQFATLQYKHGIAENTMQEEEPDPHQLACWSQRWESLHASVTALQMIRYFLWLHG